MTIMNMHWKKDAGLGSENIHLLISVDLYVVAVATLSKLVYSDSYLVCSARGLLLLELAWKIL